MKKRKLFLIIFLLTTLFTTTTSAQTVQAKTASEKPEATLPLSSPLSPQEKSSLAKEHAELNKSNKTAQLLDSFQVQEVVKHNNVFLQLDSNSVDAIIDYFTGSDRSTDEGLPSIIKKYFSRPHPSVETFNKYFTDASDEFGVPVDLLKAIAYIESNWTQYGPTVDQGWGVMHLVDNNYSKTLLKAAELIGVDPEVLKDDAELNIKASAALIKKFADNYSSTEKDATVWFNAAKDFSALVNDDLREMQAKIYFKVIQEGIVSDTIWKEKITLLPNPEFVKGLNFSSSQIKKQNSKATRSPDYSPALSNLTSCNYNSGRTHSIDTWTNHWIGTGTYGGAISWFHNCSADASAHFVIRAADGQITQVVRTANTAWHAGAVGYPYNNKRSIGVEHEVTVSNPSQWNSTNLLQASATMARHFTSLYSIPRVHNGSIPGIVGHNEMPGTSTACPGPLPWGTWMGYLNGSFDLSLYSGITKQPSEFTQNQYAKVSLNITNSGTANFNGSFAASLHNLSGSFVEDIQIRNGLTLPAGHRFTNGLDFEKQSIIASPGTYQIRIKYKPDGSNTWQLVDPGSYSNPVEVVVANPAAPDLMIPTFNVNNTTPNVGTSITLSALVRNNGNATANSTTLRYYASTNSNISTSDTELGSDYVSSLGAGSSSNESMNYTIPSSRAGSTFYVGACVEAVSGESNTSNNCSTGVSVTVSGSTSSPDLIVPTFQVSDATPDPGQSIRFTVIVRNDGSATSNSTTLRYYVSNNSGISTSDTEIGNHFLSSLDAGTISLEFMNYIIPLSRVGSTFYVGACADVVSGESNTSNNCSTGVQVTVNTPAGPDLVVPTFNANNTTPDVGTSITLSTLVRNNGNATANSTTLRYYASTDSNISTSDTELGNNYVSSLGAGVGSNHSMNYTIPSSRAGSTFYVGACVQAVSGESNTSNNCSTGVQITVNTPTAPDLVVPTFNVSNTTPDTGDSITLNALIRNDGNATSNPTILRYSKSANAAFTSPTEIGSHTIGAMSSGASQSDNLVYSPVENAGDSIWFRACVDSVSNESNTTNNCSTITRIDIRDNSLIFRNGFEAPLASTALNDTGITWGGDYPSGNNSSCTGNIAAPQDCHHGRDVTHNDDSDGHAGFSFTKLDSNGNPLPVSASTWSCVRDNVTGLVWEVKTNDGGIHDKDNTYRWGGITRQGNFGTEFYNHWDSLVNGSNTENLCGYNDWRVPTEQELLSIANHGRHNPAIDLNFFPNTQSSSYWSASPYSDYADYAWYVHFGSGSSYGYYRYDSWHVRLVRFGQ